MRHWFLIAIAAFFLSALQVTAAEIGPRRALLGNSNTCINLPQNGFPFGADFVNNCLRGPPLSFTTTRTTTNGVATAPDASGNYVKFADGVVRYTNSGAWAEEARGNPIRNPIMLGAVVGADNVELITKSFTGCSGTVCSGWTVNVGSGVVNFNGSLVQMTGDGSTNNTYISTPITGLVVGRSYIVSLASTGTFPIAVGTSAGDTSITGGWLSILGNGNNNVAPDRVQIVATASTLWVSYSRLLAASANLSVASFQDGERVMNGAFVSNPLNVGQLVSQNGWQWSAAGASTASYNSGPQNVSLTSDVSANVVNLFQPTSLCTLTANGFGYLLLYSASGGTNVVVRVGTTQQGLNLLNVAAAPMGIGQVQFFVATSTNSCITFINLTASTTVTLDDVSVISLGHFPNLWSSLWTSATTGLIAKIVGVGTPENGIDSVDINLSASASAAGGYTDMQFDTGNISGITYGQTYAQTVFAKVIAGTMPANLGAILYGLPGFNDNPNATIIASGTTPETLPLGQLRRLIRGTFLLSATTGASPRLSITSPAGAYNVTVRVGWPVAEGIPLIASTLASSVVAAGGTGGTTGAAIYSVGGGTCSTVPLVNVTVAAGAVTLPTVNNLGACTVFPPSPAPLTYVSGVGSGVVGATLTLTPTQNSALAFPTTPVLSNGANGASRSTDCPVASVVFASALSLYAKGYSQNTTGYLATAPIISADDGTLTNRSQIFKNGTIANVSAFASTVGGSQSTGAAAITQNVSSKYGASFAANAINFAANGANTASLASGLTAPIATQLHLGCRADLGTSWNGPVAAYAFDKNQAYTTSQLAGATP